MSSVQLVLPIGYKPHPVSSIKRISMPQYRAKNPKPVEFNLVHKWCLSEEERAKLDYYKLSKINCDKLAEHLDVNKGLIRKDDILFTPIYQTISRYQIKKSNGACWLSFRKFGNWAIVLVQEVR